LVLWLFSYLNKKEKQMKKTSKLLGGAALLLSLIGTADSAWGMMEEVVVGEEKSKTPNADGSLFGRINDALNIRIDEAHQQGKTIERSDLYKAAETLGDTLSTDAKKVLMEGDLDQFIREKEGREELGENRDYMNLLKLNRNGTLLLTEFMEDENDIHKLLDVSTRQMSTTPNTWKNYTLYMAVQKNKRVGVLMKGEGVEDFLKGQMQLIQNGGIADQAILGYTGRYKFYEKSENEFWGWLFLLNNEIGDVIEKGLLSEDIVEIIDTTKGINKRKLFVELLVAKEGGADYGMRSCIMTVMLAKLSKDLLFTMGKKGEAWTKELLTDMWRLLSILWPTSMRGGNGHEESEKYFSALLNVGVNVGESQQDLINVGESQQDLITEQREYVEEVIFEKTLMNLVGVGDLNRFEIVDERVTDEWIPKKSNWRSISSLLYDIVERLNGEWRDNGRTGELKSKAKSCLEIWDVLIGRAKNKNETKEETFARMIDDGSQGKGSNSVIVWDASAEKYKRVSCYMALKEYMNIIEILGVNLPPYMKAVYNSMANKRKTAHK
jgi:hypothetical protein